MSTDSQPASTHTFSPKAAAVSFLRLAATGHVREAYSAHVGPGFRHHNPYFRGDADSLSSAMEEAHTKTLEQTIEVHRAVADGDLVAVHSHVVPASGDRGWATVHILRFAGERIVEMWDIIQPVPEDSPNENGMF